eukprot:gnl/MRDRNA2_/MRDRNA2_119682_c0_seq1.p1 gnl/MRDRNA2_/MRDRNA2_119682_c0~~gnl/MRDRNA2_/MRDRNA2_119682_c0_seq1.p1  ORF type:complete len:472 (-),score=111.78 gnl/MRDRNA2_/MRDRNA2_119682_c0_seq1:62-1477(-)
MDSQEAHFSHHFAHENKGKLSEFYDLDKKKIGEGSYGSVFKAKHKDTQALRAVKNIDKKGIKDPKKFELEMSIMKEIDHPNVVRLYETFMDFKSYYLVMEICDGGELFDRILEEGETGGFTEEKVATFMKQILGAMYYIHSHNIAHRDIKPENFLMQDKNKNSSGYNTIKVIDFGLACKFSEGTKMTTKAGTPYYVAPQVLQGSYDHKCDIWSCGVIMYILLCGYPPFYGDSDNEILAMVRKGEFDFPDEEWDSVDPRTKEIIKEMLCFDDSKRPEAQVLLEREWIQGKAEKNESISSKMGQKIKENLKKFNQARMLKKSAITVIATQLADKDIDLMKKAFKAVDANGDGVISVTEMTSILKKLDLSDSEAKQTLEQLDSDGSGAIDYTEFIAAVMDKSLFTKRENLWMAFRAFDENQDGKISKEELKKFLAGDHGSSISDAKILQMIKEVDKDGDGHIDFDEFVNFMEKD